MRLTDEQRRDWLRLIRSENIGPRSFRRLVNTYGSAAAALDAFPDLARRSGKLMLRVCSVAEADAELDRLDRLGARLIAMGEPDYPDLLAQTYDAPPLVSVRGQPEALKRPMVAIVGSRNASVAGLKMAETLGRDLGEAGFTVVSGLARGIDTRAHRATLKTGTIGVLAGGLERPYPAENKGLLEDMLEHGAVISEMPVGWEPRGRDFPRRNRIISGLSLATVVVEGALRSGSLITARFANEQGREVFAVPGSPLDLRAEGTNDLIRQGATLCANATHVIEALSGRLETLSYDTAFEDDLRPASPSLYWDELDWIDTLGASEVGPIAREPEHLFVHDDDTLMPENDARSGLMKTDIDRQRQILIDALGPAPLAIDDIARLADIPVRYVQTVLLELELSGRLERHGNGSVSLRTQIET